MVAFVRSCFWFSHNTALLHLESVMPPCRAVMKRSPLLNEASSLRGQIKAIKFLFLFF